MKEKIIYKNQFGTVHTKTKSSEVDKEPKMGRCLYCSLEFECQNTMFIECNRRYLYRGDASED